MALADGRATERRIPGSLVAGIRFLGQFEELPERFTRLRAVAQEAVIGPAMVLYRGRDPGGAYHLEAVYPVDDEVEGGGVASYLVPAHQALCLRRRGPVDAPGAVFRETFDAAGREGIDLTTDPPYAVVFLEERSELEPVEADHEVEVRVAVMMPGWASQLADGVEEEGLVHLGHAHPYGAAIEAPYVVAGAKKGIAAVVAAKSLESLEYLLGVVQHRTGGIEGKRAIGLDARRVPAALGGILHNQHAVGELLAEAKLAFVNRTDFGIVQRQDFQVHDRAPGVIDTAACTALRRAILSTGRSPFQAT